MEKQSYSEKRLQKKEDFRRGYVHGYEDALKSVKGNLIVSKKGYGNGYKDSRTVISINKRYNKYKKSK